MKKIKNALKYIVPLLVMVLFLFLPLFRCYNISNNQTDSLVFGYQFVTGVMVKNGDAINTVQKIKSAWSVVFFMIFLPISICIINKTIKKDVGLKMFNFLIVSAMLMYFLLFQFYNYKYIGDSFYDYIAFEAYWPYSIVAVLLIAYFCYYGYILVKTIICSKHQEEEESLLTEDEIKERNNL